MAKREEVKEQDEQVENGPEQGKKKSFVMKYIIIGVVVLVVLGAGVGGTLFFMGKVNDKKQAAPAPAIGPVWVMEPLIVNLADNNGERYLKIALQLELTTSEAAKEMDIIKPKFRDSIVDLLSNKTYKDLADNIGKQRLRDEITLRGNSMMMSGKINKVYFTEFMIQ